MATLNPDHLLDQAERLTTAPGSGPPRQADLRRAISTAYYAVFHAIATDAADQFVAHAPPPALLDQGGDHLVAVDIAGLLDLRVAHEDAVGPYGPHVEQVLSIDLVENRLENAPDLFFGYAVLAHPAADLFVAE